MAKSELLQIRIPEEMKRMLKEVADRKGLTMSSLGLFYISNGLDNDMKVSRLVSPEGYGEILKSLPPETVKFFIDALKASDIYNGEKDPD